MTDPHDPLELLRAIGHAPVPGEDEAFARARARFERDTATAPPGPDSDDATPALAVALVSGPSGGAARVRVRPFAVLVAVAAALVLIVAFLPRRSVNVIEPADPGSTRATASTPGAGSAATASGPPATASSSSATAPGTSMAPVPGTTALVPCTVGALQAVVDRDARWAGRGAKVTEETAPLVCTGDWALATVWTPETRWDDAANAFHRDRAGWHWIVNATPTCLWYLVDRGVPKDTAVAFETAKGAPSTTGAVAPCGTLTLDNRTKDLAASGRAEVRDHLASAPAFEVDGRVYVLLYAAAGRGAPGLPTDRPIGVARFDGAGGTERRGVDSPTALRLDWYELSMAAGCAHLRADGLDPVFRAAMTCP